MRVFWIILSMLIIGTITSCKLLWVDNYKIYFIGEAICWVLAALAIKILTKDYNLKVRLISHILFWYMCSGLIDELFFDPTDYGINDYLFIVLMSIFCIYKYYKLSHNEKFSGRNK